jgi:CheY-like chemotaxis protein
MVESVALVVDDSPSVRHYVHVILWHDLKFDRILEAGNANDALRSLETEHTVNWIFSDWEMPGMSAHDFLCRVRSHPDKAGVPFLMLTARGEPEAKRLAIREGVSDYLSKPFTPEDLVRKVLRIAGLKERRSAQRVTPYKFCEIDIGFDPYQTFGADLVNVSMTGCLARTSRFNPGTGHVNDVGTLTLWLDENTPLRLNGRIARVVVDEHADPRKDSLIGFEFVGLGADERRRLKTFVDRCREKAHAARQVAVSKGRRSGRRALEWM